MAHITSGDHPKLVNAGWTCPATSDRDDRGVVGYAELACSAFPDHRVVLYVASDLGPVVGFAVVPEELVPGITGEYDGPAPEFPELRSRTAITARQLRSFALGAVEAVARPGIAAATAEPRRQLAEEGVDVLSFAADVTRPGRRGRPDGDYARTAAAYVQGIAEGLSVVEIARRLGLDAPQLRHRLRMARARGLMTAPPGKGRAGGGLTPEAFRVLDSSWTKARSHVPHSESSAQP